MSWALLKIILTLLTPRSTYSQKTRLCSRSTVASWSLLPQEHATTALLCAFFRVLRCCADSRFQNTTPPSAAALPTTPWFPATKTRKTYDGQEQVRKRFLGATHSVHRSCSGAYTPRTVRKLTLIAPHAQAPP